MAKTAWPFFDYDYGKMFKEFDFSKMIKDLNVTGLDANAILAAQQKNFEALAQANQRAAAGLQEIATRQAEIFQEAIQEVSQAGKELMTGKTPEIGAAKQTQLAKETLDRALKNMREIAEIAAKANAETFAVINKRAIESLEELKGFVARASR
jgi:phasin family protein